MNQTFDGAFPGNQPPRTDVWMRKSMAKNVFKQLSGRFYPVSIDFSQTRAMKWAMERFTCAAPSGRLIAETRGPGCGGARS